MFRRLIFNANTRVRIKAAIQAAAAAPPPFARRISPDLARTYNSSLSRALSSKLSRTYTCEVALHLALGLSSLAEQKEIRCLPLISRTHSAPARDQEAPIENPFFSFLSSLYFRQGAILGK